jgi:hypothetical protein
LNLRIPGFTASDKQAPEEPLGSRTIASRLKKYINDLAILVNGPPQIMLLTVDFDEDFINIEGIAIASMLSLQCLA